MVGYAAIAWLIRYLQSNSLRVFIVYRIVWWNECAGIRSCVCNEWTERSNKQKMTRSAYSGLKTQPRQYAPSGRWTIQREANCTLSANSDIAATRSFLA
jgi:hypothetical protein